MRTEQPDFGDEANDPRQEELEAVSGYGNCPRCTAAISPRAWFCTKCGHQVETVNPLVCRACRTPMSMWDDICSRCGAALDLPRASLKSLEAADAAAIEAGADSLPTDYPGATDIEEPQEKPRRKWWRFWD